MVMTPHPTEIIARAFDRIERDWREGLPFGPEHTETIGAARGALGAMHNTKPTPTPTDREVDAAACAMFVRIAKSGYSVPGVASADTCDDPEKVWRDISGSPTYATIVAFYLNNARAALLAAAVQRNV